MRLPFVLCPPLTQSRPARLGKSRRAVGNDKGLNMSLMSRRHCSRKPPGDPNPACDPGLSCDNIVSRTALPRTESATEAGCGHEPRTSSGPVGRRRNACWSAIPFAGGARRCCTSCLDVVCSHQTQTDGHVALAADCCKFEVRPVREGEVVSA